MRIYLKNTIHDKRYNSPNTGYGPETANNSVLADFVKMPHYTFSGDAEHRIPQSS